MIKKTASKTKKTVAKKVVVKKVAAKKKISKVKTVHQSDEKPASKKIAKVPSKKAPLKRPLKSENDGLEIALLFAQGMAERKAEEIKILDMRLVSGASTNFLVISHAQSDKQVEAIADSAEEACFNKTKERPWHREGFENLEWVLLDYINVVVHVFQKEKRGFYAIEDLWKDAKVVPFKAK